MHIYKNNVISNAVVLLLLLLLHFLLRPTPAASSSSSFLRHFLDVGKQGSALLPPAVKHSSILCKVLLISRFTHVVLKHCCLDMNPCADNFSARYDAGESV